MQLVLYKKNTTKFDNLGLGIIADAFEDSVHEIKNNSYTASFSIPKSSRFFNIIELEMLVKMKPNAIDDFDIFKVTKIDKQTDTERAVITLGHWTDNSNNYYVTDLTVDGKNPKDILSSLQLDRTSPFLFASDITETITNSKVEYKVKNPNQIILGESNSLQKLTGGLVRKRLNKISLLKNNSPRSIRLRSGKNISGLTIIRSVEGLVTRMIPYITIKGDKNLPDTVEYGKPVISNNIGKFNELYTQYVDYSSRADNTWDMQDLAGQYFDENKGIDEPTYDVQVDVFDYGSLRKEKVQCGDIAKLYDPEFDLNVDLEIYDVTYSSTLEEYQSIKAGTNSVDLFHNLESRIKDVSDKVDDVKNNVDDTKKDVDNKISEQEEKAEEYRKKFEEEIDKKVEDTKKGIDGYIKQNSNGPIMAYSPNGQIIQGMPPIGYFKSQNGNFILNADGFNFGGRLLGGNGQLYADDIVGKTINGYTVNAARINGATITGGTITGNIYINSNNGYSAAVMSADYGFSYTYNGTTYGIGGGGAKLPGTNIYGDLFVTGTIKANGAIHGSNL